MGDYTAPTWVMPEWMEPFRASITNTGGNAVEELMNDHGTTVVVNAPRAMLCVAVAAQVALLTMLHTNGLLVSPRRRELEEILMGSDQQDAQVASAALPLKGSPYELLYISKPTPGTSKYVFQHKVATTLAQALTVIEVAQAKLDAGTAEWTSGRPYDPDGVDKS